MFKNFLRRKTQTVPTVDLQQLDLDIARMLYADDQAMQLHFDRAQTALNSSRAH
jgi:hypothetical protein